VTRKQNKADASRGDTKDFSFWKKWAQVITLGGKKF
jgi:hypothetical protein